MRVTAHICRATAADVELPQLLPMRTKPGPRRGEEALRYFKFRCRLAELPGVFIFSAGEHNSLPQLPAGLQGITPGFANL